uniref:Baseplate wedge protein n=1 Tax=Myoviridae sp. ctj3P51 TaxID=2826687 RepID=A0A8S5NQU1_9CAUD|nr:MAG TPA: Baseplate wedge protein [Myoviridae sp. ctj3P51]
MAITNNRYDVTELAKADSNGFQAALFPQIKDAYVQKMKEIYGFDIDVSSASADGQFIMAQSLVLNNIYRTIESLSDNLSPASASGKYLDILSSFSGISRRGATYSTATVYITNYDTEDVTPAYLLLADKNGNRWQWLNPVMIDGKPAVTFKKYTGEITNKKYYPVAITVTCTELGAIPANAPADVDMNNEEKRNARIAAALLNPTGFGDIIYTVNATTLGVYQNDPATLGYAEETDAELRARRIKSFGQSGRTVEDSLVSNLLAVPGVIDAFVVSNNTSADITAPDGFKIPQHTVYPVVAIQKGLTVPDDLIALAIYNTMTPGIGTSAGTGSKSYTISPIENISNTIHWKEAQNNGYYMEVEMVLKNNTKDLTDDQKKAIRDAALSYLNNIPLGTNFSSNLFRQILESADFRTPKYGLPTYKVTAVNNAPTPGLLYLNRMYYSNSDVRFDPVSSSEFGPLITIKFGSSTTNWPTQVR